MAQHVPRKKVKQIVSPNKRIKHKTKGKKTSNKPTLKHFTAKSFGFMVGFSFEINVVLFLYHSQSD